MWLDTVVEVDGAEDWGGDGGVLVEFGTVVHLVGNLPPRGVPAIDADGGYLYHGRPGPARNTICIIPISESLMWTS